MATDTFPPVFVINLEQSADRRADMIARLEPLKIPYTFFKAVNGHALDIDTLPAYDRTRRRLLFGRDLSKGEIGCLLSHREIYRHIVQHNIERAIILEDDVTIDLNFPQLIREILQSPVKWDVIRFLAYEKVQKTGRNIFALPSKPHALARIPTTSGGAYGYMITQHAAQELLCHMQKNALPIDALHSYVWKTGLETFILRPSPIWSDPENNSTIGRGRFDKTTQLSGWQRALYPFTRAWLKFSELIGKRFAYWSAWPRDFMMQRDLVAAFKKIKL